MVKCSIKEDVYLALLLVTADTAAMVGAVTDPLISTVTQAPSSDVLSDADLITTRHAGMPVAFWIAPDIASSTILLRTTELELIANCINTSLNIKAKSPEGLGVDVTLRYGYLCFFS